MSGKRPSALRSPCDPEGSPITDRPMTDESMPMTAISTMVFRHPAAAALRQLWLPRETGVIFEGGMGEIAEQERRGSRYRCHGGIGIQRTQ